MAEKSPHPPLRAPMCRRTSADRSIGSSVCIVDNNGNETDVDRGQFFLLRGPTCTVGPREQHRMHNLSLRNGQPAMTAPVRVGWTRVRDFRHKPPPRVSTDHVAKDLRASQRREAALQKEVATLKEKMRELDCLKEENARLKRRASDAEEAWPDQDLTHAVQQWGATHQSLDVRWWHKLVGQGVVVLDATAVLGRAHQLQRGLVGLIVGVLTQKQVAQLDRKRRFDGTSRFARTRQGQEYDHAVVLWTLNTRTPEILFLDASVFGPLYAVRPFCTLTVEDEAKRAAAPPMPHRKNVVTWYHRQDAVKPFVVEGQAEMDLSWMPP